jgi:REP element-mobilizing transposase RayT
MRSSYTQLYVHLIWATWDRLPLITPAIEPRLYAAMAAKCRELKCIPLAIGGVEDHIYLLVRLHATTPVAVLVKEVKGASSHLVTHVICPGEFFKWQGSYSALTLAEKDLPRLKGYIGSQKQHHAAHNLLVVWERAEEDSDEK